MRRKPKRAALPIVRQKRRKNWSTNLASFHFSNRGGGRHGKMRPSTNNQRRTP